MISVWARSSGSEFKESRADRKGAEKKNRNKFAVAGLAFVAALLTIEILCAQTPPSPAYTYDVVSVHPSSSVQHGMQIGPGPQGGVRTVNTPVMMLLTFSYDVRDYQFVEGQLGCPPTTSMSALRRISRRALLAGVPQPTSYGGGQAGISNGCRRCSATASDWCYTPKLANCQSTL